jgi:hypothetical protein
MVTQLTGLEFKAFYADAIFWPESGETYHDDTLLLVDGEPVGEIDPEKINDASIVQIESGWVDEIPAELGGGKTDMSLADYFALWLTRNRPSTRLVFECHADYQDRVIAAAVAAGARLIVRADACLAEVRKLADAA